MKHSSEQIGLFVLRLGLGFFFLLWGIDKLMSAKSSVFIFDHFYKLQISVNTAQIIGIAEILFALAFILGLWKKPIYFLAIVFHGISTISTYDQLLHPFGDNHLFIAALPVLTGYIALYLLRDKDTMWTV